MRMLAAPACAVVITNGTPLGTLGHFDVDVTSGGEVNSAEMTATNASTAALQNSGNLIFDYFTYVRVGGTTYRLDNGTPAPDGGDAVVSSGTIGATGIAWSARSVLAAGNRMITTYDFESATGAPLGLQLFQYLDEDVLGPRMMCSSRAAVPQPMIWSCSRSTALPCSASAMAAPMT